MELKNMNGFCELTDNSMMEIDGGARRGTTSRVNVGSTKSAVAAQCAWTGAIVSTVGMVTVFIPPLAPVGAVCTLVGGALSYGGVATL